MLLKKIYEKFGSTFILKYFCIVILFIYNDKVFVFQITKNKRQYCPIGIPTEREVKCILKYL